MMNDKIMGPHMKIMSLRLVICFRNESLPNANDEELYSRGCFHILHSYKLGVKMSSKVNSKELLAAVGHHCLF